MFACGGERLRCLHVVVSLMLFVVSVYDVCM